MIQCQVKALFTRKQEAMAESWLPILGSVWNFAVRKIELNAKDKIYFSEFTFKALLNGHCYRLGIPSEPLRGMLVSAYRSWAACFKGISGKPRLKGVRRPQNSGGTLRLTCRESLGYRATLTESANVWRPLLRSPLGRQTRSRNERSY